MEKDYNFNEFEKSTVEEWKKKALDDLKGKFPLEKLNWEVDQELTLSPFHYAATSSLDTALNPIGEDETDRNSGWSNYQHISVLSPQFKKQSQEALNNGADGLILSDLNKEDLNASLSEILPQYCHLNLSSRNPDPELMKEYVQWIESNKFDFASIKGLYFNGMMTEALLSGKEELDSDAVRNVVETSSALPYLRTIMVDITALHNTGAGLATQIGTAIALLNQYINDLLDAGLHLNDIVPKIFFNIGVGTSFFNELAKIRAIKVLVKQVLLSYDIETQYELPHIHANNSILTKSMIDKASNLLRSTSQAVSAVLGGADSITVTAYDDTDASYRISRNISNVLREEAYLDKVFDPSKGSYYIENLTTELARKGWDYFVEIEKNGGASKVLKSGVLMRRIKAENSHKYSEFRNASRSLIGVNNYGNNLEQLSDKPWEELAQQEFNDYRYAKPFEVVRLGVESYVKKHGVGSRPKVIPIVIGSNKAMRSARINFVSNFFSWAGFDVVQELESKFILNSSEKATYVFCGADEDYENVQLEQLSHLMNIDPNNMVIYAGILPEKMTLWEEIDLTRVRSIDRKSDRLTIIEEVMSHQKIKEV